MMFFFLTLNPKSSHFGRFLDGYSTMMFFFLFEWVCGVYFPTMGMIKSKYVAEEVQPKLSTLNPKTLGRARALAQTLNPQSHNL